VSGVRIPPPLSSFFNIYSKFKCALQSRADFGAAFHIARLRLHNPAMSTLANCRAEFHDEELIIANAHFERRWRVQNAQLMPLSFRALNDETEWIAPAPSTPLPDQPREISLTTSRVQDHPLQAASLCAEFLVREKNLRLRYEFQIFPDARGVLMRRHDEGNTTAPVYSPNEQASSSGVETDAPQHTSTLAGALESLPLAPRHLKLIHPELRDQTDGHAELVLQHEYLLHPCERNLRLRGNIFVVEDVLSGRGLVWIKFAPLPHARPHPDTFDCFYNNRVLTFYGSSHYQWALLHYENGEAGRILELQRLQRQIRTYEPARDGLFLSNTWGDRSRDACINAEFISGEIEAGIKLGADVIQIDDGWENGVTANSAASVSGEVEGPWTGFWAAQPDFWEPSRTRFPDGLAPLIQKARASNLKFGLWFAPDSSNDFQNWERDAGQLLKLHRELGIEYFKLDAIKQESGEGEANLRRFFDKVLHDSGGKIVLDLDVTAETRPGYFGIPDCGPIFLQNRYTDWASYWPHSTLRAAWQLAHWVDPLRLRVEWLNNARNTPVYGDDLLAPETYTPEYMFAITMFFNPLGWFEMQNLPTEYFERAAPLVKIWKAHRQNIFNSTIIPIGDAPDGANWTGFVSIAESRDAGYALIFRERNAQEEYSFRMPLLENEPGEIELLWGLGDARFTEGKLHVSIPQKQDFLFVKIAPQS
jgi:alpha-galactosidase